MLNWMVIYPGGNRNKLDVAQVWEYEKNEWDLASMRTFEYEKDAKKYAWKLSKEHGIPCSWTHSGILDDSADWSSCG